MKILRITALVLLVPLLAGLTASGGRLPPETDQALERGVAAPLPKLVPGTTGGRGLKA